MVVDLVPLVSEFLGADIQYKSGGREFGIDGKKEIMATNDCSI
jgi:hypothetical protein